MPTREETERQLDEELGNVRPIMAALIKAILFE